MNLSINVPVNLSAAMPAAGNTVSALTESAGTSPSGASNDAAGFGSVIGELLTPDHQDPAKKNNELMSLLAMMQSLPLMQLPVQEKPLPPSEALAMVSSVLDSGTPLAELIIQDADMQSWLQNASKLLQGTATDGNVASMIIVKTNAPADDVPTKSKNMDNTAVQPANGLTFSQINLQDARRIVKEVLDSVNNTVSVDPKLQSLADRLQMVTQTFHDLLSLFKVAEPSLMNGQPYEMAQVNSSNAHHPEDTAGARNFAVNARPAFSATVLSGQEERTKLSGGTAVGLTENGRSGKNFDLEKLAAKSFIPTLVVQSEKPEASPALKGSPATDDQYGLTADTTISPTGDNGSPVQTVPVHDLLKTITNEPMRGPQASQPVPVERFTEEMTGMVMKNFKLSVKDGVTETKLSLFPQHLGHVDVKLTMHNGQLTAQFAAESAAAKEMLENQLPQLKTALQNQGLQIDKLEVTQNQNYQSAGMFQEQRQHNNANFSWKPGKGRNSRTGEEADEFALELNDAKHAAAGRWNSITFDVTA